tara:strand:- start:386 stop:1201 length:816 start_codon:yes stop_codon:yes gene_type:complete
MNNLGVLMLKDHLTELKLNGYQLHDIDNQNISGRLDFFPNKSGFEIVIEFSAFGATILLKPESWGRENLQYALYSSDRGKNRFLSIISKINEENNVSLAGESFDNNLSIDFLLGINWFESGIIKINIENHHKILESSFSLSVKQILIYLSRSIKHLFDLDDDLPTGFPEGAKKIIEVNSYERDPRNRKLCIEQKGTDCMICGFSFTATYPDIGYGFIHVHHLVPVSKMHSGYVVDPIKDLIPVCPNCHAMLHKRDPPYTPEELRDIMFPSS